MFLFLSLCIYHHCHEQVIYLLMNVYTGYNLAIKDTICIIQKNSLISVGSCFRLKKYENCANMKLKWRGECNYEVNIIWIHESK